MSIDKFFDKDCEKQVIADIEESKDILFKTFKIDLKYMVIVDDNIFRMYDKFVDKYGIEKERHGLALMYITHRYYDYMSNMLIEKYSNKPHKIPKYKITKFTDHDIEFYVDMFIENDSR